MRRRRREPVAVTLFPFMSVLACVIGTLTLLISGLALGEIGSSYVAEVELEKSLKHASENIDQRQRQVAQRQAEVTVAATQLAALEEARKVLQSLYSLRHEGEAARREVKSAELRLGTVTTRRASLEDEVEHLLLRVARLETELERQKKSLEEALQVVLLRPSGSGTDFTPEFVECLETGLVLDPDRPKRLRQFVRTVDIRDNILLERRFARAALSSDRTLIFLVRPDGIAAFMHARDEALRSGVRFGAMPVPTQKLLDFSLFGDGR